MRQWRSYRPVLGAVIAVAVQACTSERITINESDALMPTLRVTLPERTHSRHRSGRHAADPWAEVAGSVAFDNIGPPGTGHFSLMELSAGYRYATFGTDEASLDIIGGLGFNKLDLEYREGSKQIDEDISRFGPIIGAELSYMPNDWLKIYGRGTFLVLIPDGTSGQAETGFQFALSEHANLMLAWRYWRYRNEDLTGITAVNEIDIKTRGLVFGFVFNF